VQRRNGAPFSVMIMQNVAIRSSAPLWPIDKLRPLERRGWLHPQHQHDWMDGSLGRFGYVEPLLVLEDGTVVCGAARLEAARRAGMTKLPVNTVDMALAEAEVYAIAANKLAHQSEPDLGMTAFILGGLRAAGDPLNGLGFSPGELSEMLTGIDVTVDMPALASGDKVPMQHKTFTLHDSQAELVNAAMERARAEGTFDETLNKNRNGNALARVAERYLELAGPA